MTDPIPFRAANGDRAAEGAPKTPDDARVYSSEEVSEIIRVALANAGADPRDSVKHTDLLSIGREFGLSEADIEAACLRMKASQEIQQHVEKAEVFFKVHVVCYAVVMTGLFFINVLTGTNDWWVLYPLVAWGTALILHGALVKYLPKLPATIVARAMGLATGTYRNGRAPGAPARANFTLKELYGGMAEGRGIARIDGDCLHIELQIVDSVLGAIKSRVRDIVVPIEEIVDARLERGIWATKLSIQGESFHSFEGIPSETAGEITLTFTSQNRAGAERLAAQLTTAIAGQR